MKRTTLTIWEGSDGGKLMELRGENRWYIPLSEVNEKTLRELREAIDDALSEPVVSAIRQADKTCRKES